jgi:hypothetical protein
MQREWGDREAVLIERLIVASALMAFFFLALGAAVDQSPTNDEPVHMTRGAILYQTRDLSLPFEHPPLSHRLIGLLFTTEPTLPRVEELQSRPSGDWPSIAWEFMWQSGVNVDRLLFLGRLPVIWSGLFFGAILALWTSAAVRTLKTSAFHDVGGGRMAALAVVMILYATSPNLLASAALATTDFATSATYFSAVCAWWFFWQRPGRVRWLLTGTLLGLALAAKLTGALLIPLFVVLAYVYPPRRPWWRPGLTAFSLLPVAALVLWAVYGFQFGNWSRWTVPAPPYWVSWESVLTHVAIGHPAFFLGQLSSSGWWLYFPVTFLLKTPLVMLVLLALALVFLARRRPAWGMLAFTLLPAASLFAVAAYSRLNIGYRHILPALSFLVVTVGLVVPQLWGRRSGRWAIGAAMAWAVAAALIQHPHHLAYFNELAGGSAQGHRFLGDSNLDWGQDLKALAGYASAYAGETGEVLQISYDGVGDPAYYGLDRTTLSGGEGAAAPDFYPANPRPGRYAISAGHWQGLLPEADLFDWFRHRPPDDTIGYSILVYDVTSVQEGEWIAHCLSPGPLLTTEEAERLTGQTGRRHLYFDCRSSWVFPHDSAPGWIILPLQQEPWWIEDWPAALPELVYRHRANQFGPAYEIYYWPGETGLQVLLDQRIDPPHSTGPANLWAYNEDGDEWLTQWEVTAATAEPLSVQGHLYTAEPDSPPLVADGLGFTSDQWQPGDWFIQRHLFTAPGDTLETGLYNYATLERIGPVIRLNAP